ncbi:MAG: FecR domain-containing protein [Prevotella sp.]|nr:FecR domain-containing protein [Prevotella sp.]
MMNIQSIIIKSLFSELTENEQQQLDTWLSIPDNAIVYKHIVNNVKEQDDVVKFLSDIDVDNAIENVNQRIQQLNALSDQHEETVSIKSRQHHTLFTHLRPLWRYAAAVLILIVGGAALWYSQYTKVTPPEISESVQLAMQQSRESGKQDAKVDVLSEELSMMSDESGKNEELRVKSEKSLSVTESLTKEQLLSARRITTMHDKEFWLTLDDGTLVHLNYNTRLIYPEKFGRGDRNVILDGEAYFMVAKDKSRPFIVHTPNGDVKVYGTEFNVNTTGDNTSVVLVKGSVSVTPTGGKEQLMNPGQLCEFSVENLMLSTIDVEPYIAWNEGKFSFEEWPLERIMQVISRWYGREVVFTSEDIKHQQYSGNFDRYEDIHPTMEAIESITGLKITFAPGRIIIEP